MNSALISEYQLYNARKIFVTPIRIKNPKNSYLRSLLPRSLNEMVPNK